MQLNMADIYQSPADRATLLEAPSRPAPAARWRCAGRRRTATPILVRLTARTIVGRDGRESYETIAEDVTEKRALEEQLRQAQKMEAVGRLARGVAHDFNNVLAAIVGSADLLGPAASETAIRRTSRRVEIRKAAERGASFTRQLLAFSRRQAQEPQPVDISCRGARLREHAAAHHRRRRRRRRCTPRASRRSCASSRASSSRC